MRYDYSFRRLSFRCFTIRLSSPWNASSRFFCYGVGRCPSHCLACTARISLTAQPLSLIRIRLCSRSVAECSTAAIVWSSSTPTRAHSTSTLGNPHSLVREEQNPEEDRIPRSRPCTGSPALTYSIATQIAPSTTLFRDGDDLLGGGGDGGGGFNQPLNPTSAPFGTSSFGRVPLRGVFVNREVKKFTPIHILPQAVALMMARQKQQKQRKRFPSSSSTNLNATLTTAAGMRHSSALTPEEEEKEQEKWDAVLGNHVAWTSEFDRVSGKASSSSPADCLEESTPVIWKNGQLLLLHGNVDRHDSIPVPPACLSLQRSGEEGDVAVQSHTEKRLLIPMAPPYLSNRVLEPTKTISLRRFLALRHCWISGSYFHIPTMNGWYLLAPSWLTLDSETRDGIERSATAPIKNQSDAPWTVSGSASYPGSTGEPVPGQATAPPYLPPEAREMWSWCQKVHPRYAVQAAMLGDHPSADQHEMRPRHAAQEVTSEADLQAFRRQQAAKQYELSETAEWERKHPVHPSARSALEGRASDEPIHDQDHTAALEEQDLYVYRDDDPDEAFEETLEDDHVLDRMDVEDPEESYAGPGGSARRSVAEQKRLQSAARRRKKRLEQKKKKRRAKRFDSQDILYIPESHLFELNDGVQWPQPPIGAVLQSILSHPASDASEWKTWQANHNSQIPLSHPESAASMAAALQGLVAFYQKHLERLRVYDDQGGGWSADEEDDFVLSSLDAWRELRGGGSSPLKTPSFETSFCATLPTEVEVEHFSRRLFRAYTRKANVQLVVDDESQLVTLVPLVDLAPGTELCLHYGREWWTEHLLYPLLLLRDAANPTTTTSTSTTTSATTSTPDTERPRSPWLRPELLHQIERLVALPSDEFEPFPSLAPRRKRGGSTKKKKPNTNHKKEKEQHPQQQLGEWKEAVEVGGGLFNSAEEMEANPGCRSSSYELYNTVTKARPSSAAVLAVAVQYSLLHPTWWQEWIHVPSPNELASSPENTRVSHALSDKVEGEERVDHSAKLAVFDIRSPDEEVSIKRLKRALLRNMLSVRSQGREGMNPMPTSSDTTLPSRINLALQRWGGVPSSSATTSTATTLAWDNPSSVWYYTDVAANGNDLRTTHKAEKEKEEEKQEQKEEEKITSSSSSSSTTTVAGVAAAVGAADPCAIPLPTIHKAEEGDSGEEWADGIYPSRVYNNDKEEQRLSSANPGEEEDVDDDVFSV